MGRNPVSMIIPCRKVRCLKEHNEYGSFSGCCEYEYGSHIIVDNEDTILWFHPPAPYLPHQIGKTRKVVGF